MSPVRFATSIHLSLTISAQGFWRGRDKALSSVGTERSDAQHEQLQSQWIGEERKMNLINKEMNHNRIANAFTQGITQSV